MPFYVGQTDYIQQLNALETAAGRTTYAADSFAVYDSTDSTKVAKFDASTFPTATTYTYTLPPISGTLATLTNTAQTFQGSATFSNASGSFGTSTATSTYNYASGATVSGATKTINFATGGAAGSTTTVNIGTSAGAFSMTIRGYPLFVGGIKLGSGALSTDVNTIDYYQEGVFTPVVVGRTTAGTGTYASQIGKYTRFGNVVHFQIALDYSGHTGTGNMTITGLPWASDTTMIVPVTARPGTVTYTQRLSAYVEPNSTAVILESIGNASAPVALPMSAAGTLWVSGSYIVA